MSRLLNRQRPPAFCPGCSHDRVVQALGRSLEDLGLTGHQVAIVSDIGCSGLFDTFFNTHAFHGLHGRALTYATGLKLARPELTVVTTMGDGGMGIGGAHFLSACRRNLDITLLVLNNFNYGMTGGQCSATTPADALTASGFLNRLEPPLDICRVAAAAGATYVARAAAAQKELAVAIQRAIAHTGFSILEIRGLCPGRYTKRNRQAQSRLESDMAAASPAPGPVAANQRDEYGHHFGKAAARQQPIPPPRRIEIRFAPLFKDRREILLLGSAGQRINTAGEILCLAAMTAGMAVTQKNDYPITVLRGHSISEVVLSRSAVGYTGLQAPRVVLALSADGVQRRREIFDTLDRKARVIAAQGPDLPPTRARVQVVDFKALGFKPAQWALAGLGLLARGNDIIGSQMLDAALEHRLHGTALEEARAVLQRVADIPYDVNRNSR
jgi:2-oxoglutarate/2-oxoacid ferredoxin oxidoreductase subunit beta